MAIQTIDNETHAQVRTKLNENFSDLDTRKADKVTAGTTGNFAALGADGNIVDSTRKHSDYEPANSNIQAHISNTSNPHTVTKTQVGLGNVDNTSDSDKNSATATLTNKRINPREITVASGSAPTPNGDTTDIYTITALAEAPTIGAPTGTPVQGQKLVIRIKDNGTARGLSWNAIYRASSDLALPTTTVLGKTMYCGFMYNATDSKWDFVAFLNNI